MLLYILNKFILSWYDEFPVLHVILFIVLAFGFCLFVFFFPFLNWLFLYSLD